MIISRKKLWVNDITSPEAIAFWEYAIKLKFVTAEEDEEITLNQDQIEAIEEGRKSLKKNGGIPHEEVMARMKEKFPTIFKA